MSSELLAVPALTGPIILTRGDPFIHEIQLQERGEWIANFGIRAAFRATNDPSGEVLSVPDIKYAGQGRAQITVTRENLLHFPPGPYGWLFVEVNCAETRYEWHVKVRAPAVVR